MIDEKEIEVICESLNIGGSLPPVNVEDLKGAWARFTPYSEPAVQQLEPTTVGEALIGESFGTFPDNPAVFFRCMMLASLKKQGVIFTESVFEEVAALPMNLESIAALVQRKRPPKDPGQNPRPSP
jgi:hypothetical protein